MLYKCRRLTVRFSVNSCTQYIGAIKSRGITRQISIAKSKYIAQQECSFANCHELVLHHQRLFQFTTTDQATLKLCMLHSNFERFNIRTRRLSDGFRLRLGRGTSQEHDSLGPFQQQNHFIPIFEHKNSGFDLLCHGLGIRQTFMLV